MPGRGAQGGPSRRSLRGTLCCVDPALTPPGTDRPMNQVWNVRDIAEASGAREKMQTTYQTMLTGLPRFSAAKQLGNDGTNVAIPCPADKCPTAPFDSLLGWTSIDSPGMLTRWRKGVQLSCAEIP